MTISEAQAYFKSKYYCELIDANPSNRELVESFQPNEYGTHLADYLKNPAWDEHQSGEKRFYLIKTIDGEIVAYFTLQCGLLFNTHHFSSTNNADTLEAFNILVQALDDSSGEKYNQAIEYLSSLYDDAQLQSIKTDAERKYNLSKEDNPNRGELRVQQTYSAIELVHFCRNYAYSDTSSLYGEETSDKIPLGFFLFWEIIVPKIQEIINSVGCKYIFLFAADKDDKHQTLRDYYKRNLNFKETDTIQILIPDYDSGCFPLFQEANNLETARQNEWLIRSDFFDDE